MCKSTGHLLVQLVYYDQRTNGGICEVQFETRPTTTRRLYTRDGRRGEQEQTACSPLQRHVSFQWETFCRSLPDRKNKISRLCLMRCTTSDSHKRPPRATSTNRQTKMLPFYMSTFQYKYIKIY